MSLYAKHKSLPPKTRQMIYEKYNGHCAYCGCEITYKEMQVDHIIAKYNEEISEINTDTMDNYMPTCRQCNFYKSTFSLEDFRQRLTTVMIDNLRKNFNYRLGIKYGLIEENIKPIEFYFERRKREMCRTKEDFFKALQEKIDFMVYCHSLDRVIIEEKAKELVQKHNIEEIDFSQSDNERSFEYKHNNYNEKVILLYTISRNIKERNFEEIKKGSIKLSNLTMFEGMMIAVEYDLRKYVFEVAKGIRDIAFNKYMESYIKVELQDKGEEE